MWAVVRPLPKERLWWERARRLLKSLSSQSQSIVCLGSCSLHAARFPVWKNGMKTGSPALFRLFHGAARTKLSHNEVVGKKRNGLKAAVDDRTTGRQDNEMGYMVKRSYIVTRTGQPDRAGVRRARGWRLWRTRRV